MTTVLVVDDSEIDRRLVSGLLAEDDELAVDTAANGAEALRWMQQVAVDLVITDMQMPELDGLELVRQIRIQSPQVPVILMTAHGSESLAVEALAEGAASYVPKSELAEKLRDTVRQVLSLGSVGKSYERLTECQTRAEFTFLLDNDPGLIDPLVDLVQQIVFRMKLCDANGRYRVGMALQQALLNALVHGNLEISFGEMEDARERMLVSGPYNLIEQRRNASPYSQRRIFVDVKITREEAQFVVRDEGQGFDHAAAVSERGAARLEGGRGLRLMRTFMDEVRFNPAGNEVTMIKRRTSSVGNGAAR